jgi:hypothetical protein
VTYALCGVLVLTKLYIGLSLGLWPMSCFKWIKCYRNRACPTWPLPSMIKPSQFRGSNSPSIRKSPCYNINLQCRLRHQFWTYLLTELSPFWGAANCAAPQKIPSDLWNSKVQYRVHKNPPLVPILSHINQIRTIPSYLSKIEFNIVRPPTSWSSQWSVSFWRSHQCPICIPLLPHSCYIPRQPHPFCTSFELIRYLNS